jgi:hypothetical protein
VVEGRSAPARVFSGDPRSLGSIMTVTWQIELPKPFYKEGAIIYREGEDFAECTYMLGGGNVVWILLGCRDWDAKYPWFAGRQEEVLRRVAEALVQNSGEPWRIEVDPSKGGVTIRLQWTVDLDGAIKDGIVKYSEGPRRMDFALKKGTSPVVFTIVGPEDAKWAPFKVHSPLRRHEVLARIADEVVRRLAPGCVPDYDESRPSEMRILLPSEGA